MNETRHHTVSMPEDVRIYSNYIKAIYKRKRFPTYVKSPSPSLNYFINLKLHVRVNQVNTSSTLVADIYSNDKSKIELEQIGLTQDGEENSINILIEGDAGTGKTTLMWELCKKWSKGQLQSHNWDIVLLIQLENNNIKEAKDINDFLHCSNRSIDSKVDSVSDYILSTLGEKVVLILDGYDELSSDQGNKNIFIQKLLSGEVLPKAVIIVTCRPAAVSRLPIGFSDNIHQHIVIAGFSDDSIDSFIKCKFQEPKHLENFQSYISCNPFLQSVMHNPLCCALLTELYSTSWTTEFSSQTITQLFTQFITCLLQRGNNDCPENLNINDLSNVPVKFGSDLLTLAKLAAEGIENGQYVWDNLKCNTLSLMQCEENNILGRPNTISFRFHHLIFQEYLAALHWSQKVPTNYDLLEDESVLPIMKYLEGDVNIDNSDRKFIEPVIHFYIGLTKIPIGLMKEIYSSLEVCHGHLLCKLLFETQNEELIRSVLDDQSIHCKLFSELDSYCAGYCISISLPSTKFFIKIDFKHIPMFCRPFAKESLQSKAKIKNLDIYNIVNFTECIRTLHHMPWYSTVINCSFHFTMNEISTFYSDQCLVLSELFPNLQILEVSNCDSRIFGYLTGIKCLTTLKVTCCDTYESSTLVPVTLPSLQHLIVGSSSIPVSYLIMYNLKTLVHIELVDCNISEEDSLKIAKAFNSLSPVCPLKNVDVSCDILSSVVIVGAVVKNNSLDNIFLHSSSDKNDVCHFNITFSNNRMSDADDSFDQKNIKDANDHEIFHQESLEKTIDSESSYEHNSEGANQSSYIARSITPEEVEELISSKSDEDEMEDTYSDLADDENESLFFELESEASDHDDNESFSSKIEGTKKESDNYMNVNIDHIDGEGFALLATGLQHTHVNKLTMTEVFLESWSNEDFTPFCSSLSNISSLKHVEFIDVHLDITHIQAITQQLFNKSQLYSIHFTNNSFDLFDALSLSDAVTNSNIAVLKVENEETDDGNLVIEYKKDSLLTPKVELNGEYEEEWELKTQRLFETLSSSVHVIRSLKIHNINLHTSLSALSHALGRNTTLISLKITGHSCIKKVGALTLAAGLRRNKSLRSLKILDFSIGTAGADAIKEAFPTGKTNRSLTLSSHYQKNLTTQQIHETYCQICGKKFGESEFNRLAGCDECTRWYHISCVDIDDISKHWKCPEC